MTASPVVSLTPLLRREVMGRLTRGLTLQGAFPTVPQSWLSTERLSPVEQTPPPLPPNQEPAPQSSLFDHLIDIFAAPGDVFDEIKLSEVRLRNWLVPVTLVTVLMVASF